MPMSRSDARVIDPVLSNVALGYRNGRYVGLSLYPTVFVPKSGVSLIKFGKEAFVKYNMRRAPGAKTARVQYGYATDPVALVQDSLEGKVPREWMRDTQDVPLINQETRAVNNVMQSMHLGLEIDIAQIATNAGNYGADNKITLTGTDKWTDGSSKLSVQMDAYKEAVRSKIGIDPNRLILSPGDFNACKNHPEVKERFKYTSSESITADMLAAFFDLELVEVGKTVWTPDVDSDLQNCWGSSVLGYVAPEGERDMDTPSCGYTYVLDNHPLVEEAYFDKSCKSYIYPVEYERRPYQTGMDAAFLIQGASS